MPSHIQPKGGIRTYNTVVVPGDAGEVHCILYSTRIATLSSDRTSVTLNTGGFNTPTTMRRMNECLNAWGFSQRVRKADFAKSNTLTLTRFAVCTAGTVYGHA